MTMRELEKGFVFGGRYRIVRAINVLFGEAIEQKPSLMRLLTAMSKRHVLKILLGLACMISSSSAWAQHEAVAAEHFNRGWDAKEAGEYPTCIQHMEASHRAVAATQTLFYLAECEEKAARIATADLHYQQVIDNVRALRPAKQVSNAQFVADAEKARERLRGEVPSLTLNLPVWAPKNVEVACDGKVVPLAAIGVAIPVDPGEHLVTTQVPGGQIETHHFTVKPKEAVRLKLRIDMPSRLDAAKPSTSPSKDEVLRSLRTPGYISLGVGGAGLLTWAIAGLIMIHEKSTIETFCSQYDCSLPEHSDTLHQSNERGVAAGNVASVGLGLGLTGGVLGTAMLIGSSQRFRQTVAQSAVRVEIGHDGMIFKMRGIF